MQLILLIAGLILLLTDGWFDQQQTVGWVLVGATAFITLLQLAMIAAVGSATKKVGRRF